MAVGNLHPKAEDHAGRVARFAQDAIKESSKIPVHEARPDLGMINMRIGFHTGPVVASVVGNLNPRCESLRAITGRPASCLIFVPLLIAASMVRSCTLRLYIQ